MTNQGHGLGTTILQAASQTVPLLTNRRDSTVHAKYTTTRDIRAHGNGDNQTTANDVIWFNGDTSYTYNDTRDEDYDERHALINVDIIKGKGALVRMTGAGRNLMLGVTGRNSGKEGVYSFQDNNFANVDMGWAGWAAFAIAGDDCRLTDCKGWYSGQVDSTKGPGFSTSPPTPVPWRDARLRTTPPKLSGSATAVIAPSGIPSPGSWRTRNSKGSAGTYPQIKVQGANNNVEATVRNRYKRWRSPAPWHSRSCPGRSRTSFQLIPAPGFGV